MRLAFVAPLALLAGCGSAEPAPETDREAPRAEAPSPAPTPSPEPTASSRDGLFVAEGAPEPRACAEASDCMGDTAPDPDQPCCANPYGLTAYSRAYHAWWGEWRGAHCAGVTCPPPPAPAPPPDCAFELQCVEGRCADSCP